MVSYCYGCRTRHKYDRWTSRYENGKIRSYCHREKPIAVIGKDGLVLTREQRRINHWGEIKSRITTHEGEVLHGTKGRNYQQKWGQKYLGIQPNFNFNQSEYQRELAKKK